MRLTSRISEYFKKQTVFLTDNRQEIEEANQKTCRLALHVGIATFALLLVISFFYDHYARLTLPYAAAFLALCLYTWIEARVQRVVRAANLLYIGYGLLTVYCTLVSAFVMPEGVGVMILLFLFQIPIVVIDKSWRVVLVDLCFAGFYLGFVLTFKSPRLVADELLNCLLFVCIGLIFGEYLRNTKLENFDLKRRAVVCEHTDFLTGLFNRRKLFEALRTLEHDGGFHDTVGLIMLDVDFFKRYNDTYGHLMGDECLKRIGDSLRGIERTFHIPFYRYGGEEFVGVATGYAVPELSDVCKVLNEVIYQMQIPHETSPLTFVTVSIGFSFRQAGEVWQAEALIFQADTALYAAKKAGRNTAVPYRERMEESTEFVFQKRDYPGE